MAAPMPPLPPVTSARLMPCPPPGRAPFGRVEHDGRAPAEEFTAASPNGEPVDDVVVVAGAPQRLDFEVGHDVVEAHVCSVTSRTLARYPIRGGAPSAASSAPCTAIACAGVFDAADGPEPAVRAQWIGDVAMTRRAADDASFVPFHDAIEQAHPLLVRNAARDPGSVQGSWRHGVDRHCEAAVIEIVEHAPMRLPAGKRHQQRQPAGRGITRAQGFEPGIGHDIGGVWP